MDIIPTFYFILFYTVLNVDTGRSVDVDVDADVCVYADRWR